jgi:hypothetical protein
MDQTHLNFALLGGALFAGGLIWMGRSQLLSLHPVRTSGRVMKVETKTATNGGDASPSGKRYCYPTVRFADDRGALRIYASRRRTSTPYAVGDGVTIVYDRDNPSKAKIFSPNLLRAQAITVGAGIVMLLFGLAM